MAFDGTRARLLQSGALGDRVAWITGGGSGLGRAMAERFAALGATVAISGRREKPLEETVAAIEAAGGKALAVPLDVRDAEAVAEATGKVVEGAGGLDILVNNAAGNFICPAEDLTPGGFDAVVKIVLYGTFNCTQSAGKYWIAQKRRGVVLSITTTYAETGSAFVLPSACAKAGVSAMTKSLAAEWGRHDIRLNAIAPGPIPTEGAFSRLLPSEGLMDQLERKIPAGRFGTQEELAELAAFLCSDAADWIRGETVTIDGGEWLRGAGEFNDFLDLPPEMWEAFQKKIAAAKRR